MPAPSSPPRVRVWTFQVFTHTVSPGRYSGRSSWMWIRRVPLPANQVSMAPIASGMPSGSRRDDGGGAVSTSGGPWTAVESDDDEWTAQDKANRDTIEDHRTETPGLRR